MTVARTKGKWRKNKKKKKEKVKQISKRKYERWK